MKRVHTKRTSAICRLFWAALSPVLPKEVDLKANVRPQDGTVDISVASAEESDKKKTVHYEKQFSVSKRRSLTEIR